MYLYIYPQIHPLIDLRAPIVIQKDPDCNTLPPVSVASSGLLRYSKCSGGWATTRRPHQNRTGGGAITPPLPNWTLESLRGANLVQRSKP